MRLDRLKKAELSLEDVESVEFTLSMVGGRRDCGSVACVCGWYIVKFPDEGLGYVGPNGVPHITGQASDKIPQHFGLTWDEAKHLFYPFRIPSPAVTDWDQYWKDRQAHNSLEGTRQRIRDFISTHSKARPQ